MINNIKSQEYSTCQLNKNDLIKRIQKILNPILLIQDKKITLKNKINFLNSWSLFYFKNHQTMQSNSPQFTLLTKPKAKNLDLIWNLNISLQRKQINIQITYTSLRFLCSQLCLMQEDRKSDVLSKIQNLNLNVLQHNFVASLNKENKLLIRGKIDFIQQNILKLKLKNFKYLQQMMIKVLPNFIQFFTSDVKLFYPQELPKTTESQLKQQLINQVFLTRKQLINDSQLRSKKKQKKPKAQIGKTLLLFNTNTDDSNGLQLAKQICSLNSSKNIHQKTKMEKQKNIEINFKYEIDKQQFFQKNSQSKIPQRILTGIMIGKNEQKQIIKSNQKQQTNKQSLFIGGFCKIYKSFINFNFLHTAKRSSMPDNNQNSEQNLKGSRSTLTISQNMLTILAYKQPSCLQMQDQKKTLLNKQVDQACFQNQYNFLSFLRNQKCQYFPKYYDSLNNGIIWMQMYRQNLQTLIQKQQNKLFKLNLTQKLIIVHDIAKGIEVLIDNNLIHRDLKPPNILISKNLRAKIIDFGSISFSYLKQPKFKIQSQKLYSTKGYFLLYQQIPSQELKKKYKKNHYYTHEKFDIYSLGKILKYICSKQLKKPSQQLKQIKQIRKNIKSLIRICCQPDPQKRPEITQVISHIRSIIQLENRFHLKQSPNENEETFNHFIRYKNSNTLSIQYHQSIDSSQDQEKYIKKKNKSK